jgi:hypothetical protein
MASADFQNFCYVVSLALAVGLVFYGFMQLLQREKPSENDVQVLQRQLRGFGYLMLAQLILVIGMAFCVGLNLDGFKQMVRSVRM